MLIVLVGSMAVIGAPPVADVSRAPRMACRLMLNAGDQFELALENASTRKFDVVVRAKFILTPEPPPPSEYPPAASVSYGAPLDLSGADVAKDDADETRLEMAPSATRTWTGRLTSLPWHREVSSTRLGSRPFRQVVPEGRYKLTFQVQGHGVGACRSSEHLLEVRKGRLLDPDMAER